MPKLYKFLMEKSLTPISQRIIKNLSKTLIEFGHQVILADPSNFDNSNQYIDSINNTGIDFCIISNSFSALGSLDNKLKDFLFLKLEMPIIFIHHDDLFSRYFTLEQIYSHLEAFLKIQDQSFHFCLEYSNFLDLKALGIKNVFQIFHASEFESINSQNSNEILDISFVGHFSHGHDEEIEPSFSYLLKADFWKRISELDQSLEPSSLLFAKKNTYEENDKVEYFSKKFFYRAALHKLSSNFRGEIIDRVYEKYNLDIFGGSTAYLHGHSNKILPLTKKNLKYHAATHNYSEVRKIYTNSKINLNITSLQFDTAVINRVIDVGFSGGFILTDWKDDLRKITSVSEEISYKSIDQLNSKIEYYLPRDKERKELSIQFQKDVAEKCSYPIIIKFILSKLTRVDSDDMEILNIDLGCGSSKPNGFIGVDIFSSPDVDIVADLTRSFPFPDCSVDVVRAHDTIEHLPDRIHTMNEIWRVCKPNAIVDIRVPSTDGRAAFQDPTHVSYWNANSFNYYSVEFPSYLELCHKYGFNGQFSLKSLESFESKDQVVHVHAILTAIKYDKGFSSSHPQLDFRDLNILVIINWAQPEMLLNSEIFELLKIIKGNKNSIDTHLFFLFDKFDVQEDINLIFSGIVMNFLIIEDADEADLPKVSFIPYSIKNYLQSIASSFSAQILFDPIHEVNCIKSIPVFSLANLSTLF
jgi:spore maturation protein CgeB/predicted SAM-dependent methyltransferase